MQQGCIRHQPAARCSRLTRRRQLRTLCFSSTNDLYSILSVPATATPAEIKAAYRKLVHDLHPDKHAHKEAAGQATTADAFVRCKLAYEVLSDTEQRRQYDEALAAAGGAAADGQGRGQAPAQAWSPYNGWMDAYEHSSQHSSQRSHEQANSTDPTTAGQDASDYYQTLQEATAATAAAGASSSGLSDYRDPLASTVGAEAGTHGADEQQQGAAGRQPSAVRAALLDEHGIALEQFSSLQDAVSALAEREQQQTVVGLAEGDYDNAWQL